MFGASVVVAFYGQYRVLILIFGTSDRAIYRAGLYIFLEYLSIFARMVILEWVRIGMRQSIYKGCLFPSHEHLLGTALRHEPASA